MKSIYFILFPFFIFACKPPKVEFLTLTFIASECFGRCPVFTMTIDVDGTAFYDAKMHNDKQGKFHTIIKSPQLDSLNMLVGKSDMLNLDNSYSSSWTDEPTYTLIIKFKNGQIKTISDYGPNGPDKLKKVYNLLFSLRLNQDWR